jgi:hypothetical protein
MNKAQFDLVLSQARVVDSCGSPWYRGNLDIRRGCITVFARAATLRAEQGLPVEGCFLVPGATLLSRGCLHLYTERIDDVRLRRTLVVQGSEHTGALPGRVLRQRYRPGQ